jgi:hypothetical protein
VYERGVHGIYHSVDLWTYYCSFVTEKSGDMEVARKYVVCIFIFSFVILYALVICLSKFSDQISYSTQKLRTF